MDTPSNGDPGFDVENLDKHLKVIAEADDELASLLGSYRADCKIPRSRIKNVMAMAKDEGLPMAAFRQIVAAHRAKRRLEKQIDELEADDADAFERMMEALGGLADTPLGAAAIKRARRDRGEAALSTL